MGYVTDVYDGWTKSSGVCPFPNGTFQDGRDICDWSALFTFETNTALIPTNQNGFRGQITEECMTAAQKTAFFARVKADGGDVRVTGQNGKSEMPSYVHYVDIPNEKVWISWRTNIKQKVPTIIKVYVGNAAATAYPVGHALGRNAVFQDFNYFFDFAQDPTGGAPQLTDLTGNANSGTATNGPTAANGPQGMSAWDFVRASSQKAALTDNNIQGEGDQTFSCWFNSDDIALLQGLASVIGSGTTSDYFVCGIANSKITVSGSNSTGSSRQSSVLSSNTWYRLFIRKATGGINLLKINGADDTNAATAFWGGSIGGDGLAIADQVVDRFLDGLMTSAAWRAGWVTGDRDVVEYNNESDPNSFIPCTNVFFN